MLRSERLESRQMLTVEPISAVFGAIAADGPSFLDGAAEHATSANGRFVVFTSSASDLVAPGLDLNNASDVFLYDRSDRSVTLVSRASGAAGETPDGASFAPLLSDDGRVVVFLSTGTNLVAGQVDGNLAADLFRFDALTGETTLVSHVTGLPNAAGDGAVLSAAMNSRGTTIAFDSLATNLAAPSGDSNAAADVFVWRDAPATPGGVVALASRAASAAQSANARSWGPVVDGAGLVVLFNSDATNLVAGQQDANAAGDVFLHNIPSQTNSLVSGAAGSPTTTANGASQVDGIDYFGQRAVLASNATNLAPVVDLNAGDDVYLLDVAQNSLSLVSHAAGAPLQAAGAASSEPRISADGRFVAFVSAAADIAVGVADAAGLRDVFLYDRIAGTSRLVSHAAALPMTPADGDSTSPELSGDGRFVAFQSLAANLIGGATDANGVADVFVWDAAAPSVQLASHVDPSLDPLLATAGNGASSRPAVSRSGRAIAFQSDAANLFLNDFNLASDVFLSAAPGPNGAPVLDPLISSTIQTGAPSGTAVDDILAVAGLYSDDDPLFKGLAIVAADDPRGAWEFSTDSGGHWAPLGPTSNPFATLLSADGAGRNRVRFLPAEPATFSGVAALSFRAWDGTDGGLSGFLGVDVSVNGFDSAYSAEGALALAAGPSNVAPTIAAFGKTALENAALSFAAGDFAAAFADADGDRLQIVSIASLPSHGTLSLAGAPVAAGQAILAVDLPNLTYQGNLGYVGPDAFDWTASDGLLNSPSPAAVNIVVEPDTIAPTVSVNQSTGQADPTNAGVVYFTVVFSEPVFGFDDTKITLGGTAGATDAFVATADDVVFDVAVSGMTQDGTVIATVAAGVAKDAALNPNLPSTSLDNVVVYDATAPSVSVERAVGQADATNAGVVFFTVVFSEPVIGFDSAGIQISGDAGATTAAVTTDDNAVFRVAVSGMSTDGTVVVDVGAGAAHDAAGNFNEASTSLANVVVYDATAPTAVVNQAAGQADPTSLDPIRFTVAFSEPVFGFDAARIQLSGTAGATTVEVMTNDNVVFDVTVGGMTQNGTVIAAVDAGAAHDAAGNFSAAATSDDNVVDFVAGPAPQTVPLLQTFSAGLPGAATGWEFYSSNQGRIAAVAGRLRMDDAVNDSVLSLNEAVLHVNLSGRVEVQLQLDHQSSADQANRFAGARFRGHVNADLIALSVNGTDWVKVTDLSTNFTGRAFALDALLRQAAQAAGASDLSDVRIKFQQYGRAPWGANGRSFDNVRITGALPSPRSLPYAQNFAAGRPNAAQGWEYYSTNEGRVAVVAGQLRFDDRANNAVASLNEAILHLNLAGQSNVQLRLDHRNSADANNPLADTEFTGHVNADLIAVSVDGAHWVKLTDLGASFTGRTFPLDAAVQQAALAAGGGDLSNVRIKFQQYGNGPWGIDGRALDNIAVTAAPPALRLASAASLGAITPSAVDRIDLAAAASDELGRLAGLEQFAGPDDLKSRGLPARASRALGRAGGNWLAPERNLQPGRMPPQ